MSRLLLTTIILTLIISNVFAQGEELSLDDCIQIALKNNYNIKISKYFKESAEEDVTSSYSGILPNASVSASISRFEVGPVEDIGDFPVGIDSVTGLPKYESRKYTQPGFGRNSNSLNLRISQNIFDGGEWWNAISYAKSQNQSSEFEMKSTVNSTVRDVQSKYFELLKQQKLLEVNEIAVQRSQDQLDKTQKMFELGAVAKVDVFRSKVNLGNDKIQLLTQKNAVITAKNNLNLALGREPDLLIKIKPELQLRTTFDNVDTLILQALNNNPQIKKNKEEYNSSNIMTSRAYSVLYPSLGAFFNYSRSNEELNKVYSDYDKNWNISFGVSLSLNLFNGFRDKVNIQKSKLSAKNALANYEIAKLSTRASVVQLVDNYNSYLEIIKINEENLEAAKEEYRLAEERYRIGSGTQLEVREAQVNLTRAEQTLVAAQYNARITQAQLEEALGTIYAKN